MGNASTYVWTAAKTRSQNPEWGIEGLVYRESYKGHNNGWGISYMIFLQNSFQFWFRGTSCCLIPVWEVWGLGDGTSSGCGYMGRGHHLPALNLLLKEWIIDLYGSALQPQSSASYTWMFLAASSPWKWLVVRGKDRTAWRMPEPQKNPTESTLVFLLLSCLTCRPIMVVTDVCELGFLAKSWSLFSVKD